MTYTSLLALVPLLTIVFAILAAFPAFESVQEQARTLIFTNLVPSVGEAILTYLDLFTRNAGKLTSFGVGGLAITSIMLLATIESAFNSIWKAREPRPILLRFLAFWAILSLGPLLFGLGLSLSGTVSNILETLQLNPLGMNIQGLLSYIVFLIEIIGFMALYSIIPNRAVEWRDALTGGVIAAILFELSKRGFAWYLAAFPAYQTIYGALALIPIFLLWLYIAWSTVLFGAVVAASLPEWRSDQLTDLGREGLLPSQKMTAALAILNELYAASLLGVSLRRATLLTRVPVGGGLLDTLLEELLFRRWVTRSYRDTWLLSRQMTEATLADLQDALNIGWKGHVQGLNAIQAPWTTTLLDLLEKSDGAARRGLNMPLSDFFDRARAEEKA